MNNPTPEQPQPRKDRTAGMSYEHKYRDAGYTVLLGMDEAGYGAWAGPLAAAAVCLNLHDNALTNTLKGVKDSKQMTPHQRENAYDVIKTAALGYGIGHATPSKISEQGLSAALSLAYARAYAKCTARLDGRATDVLLIDGKSAWKDFPHNATVTVKRLPKGDTKSLSIAAASVLAKVWRDRQLIALGKTYPEYGFEQHKGYGTRAHQDALNQHGVLHDVHRRNYRPIRALLNT